MKKTGILSVLILSVIVSSCSPSAKRLFSRGQERYEQEEFEYAKEDFKQALAKGGPRAESNYYIAEAYRKSNRIHDAESYYKDAIDAGIKDEEAYFYYAKAMTANGKYENAKEQYRKFLKIASNFDLIDRAKAEIENLKLLSDVTKKKTWYDIRNLEELNSEGADYAPVLFNNSLFFTSSRGSEKVYGGTGTGFTDIYEFIFDGVEKYSGQAKRLPKSINSENAHEACAVFSKDGRTMYLTRSNTGKKKEGSHDVNLYMSKMVKGEWSEPVMMKISDEEAWDSTPMLSADGKTLYFASNREGGMGGTDLYKATRDSTGDWGNVENLGAPFNTSGNEMFPFEYEDGTFYFSSDGHPTLGGLDVFVVTEDEEGELAVENMGSPLNSTYDDFGIFKTDSISGFYCSNRPDGKGDDDIYEFVDKSRVRIAIYSIDGTAFGTEDEIEEHILAGATIRLIDDNGDTLSVVKSDPEGKFELPVEPEKNYRIVADKPGEPAYLRKSFELSTKDETVAFEDLEPGDNEIKIPFSLTLMAKKKIKFVVDNIYYDYDKANIKPSAAKELDKIVAFLDDNRDITIELSSHTDERGDAEYNRKLSQRRADSAVAYIIKQGIESERITAMGYGKSQPLIVGAKTEEEHQKNRRTEVKITGILEDVEIDYKGESFNKSKPEDQIATEELIPEEEEESIGEIEEVEVEDPEKE
ncbi:OmpA family protein [Cytophagaceae bacterium ABcell3]|nr:OmpA family protein [Cytophagaceae bacterium ABcell3]